MNDTRILLANVLKDIKNTTFSQIQPGFSLDIEKSLKKKEAENMLLHEEI